MSGPSRLALAARFAAREMRSGVRGFRIFLACLALGVAAIAAAGSTAEAFRQGLAAQSRDILGGDVSASLENRRFDDEERALFDRLGEATYAVRARAMAEAPSGERRLVELRGVDGLYPLAGAVEVRDGEGRILPLPEALAFRDGLPGAAAETALIDRLGLTPGDVFTVGNQAMRLTGVLVSEPDRMSRGFQLGPRVLTSLAGVEAGGFLGPGALYGETARIVLDDAGADTAALRDRLRRDFSGEGVRVRDRSNAAPGVQRMIDRLEYFLGFIGLSSLLAGGLGVAGAVSAYLEMRKPSIAVLKALGAEGGLVRDVYLIQIAVLAGLGVALGLVVGAAAPFVLAWAVGDDLPVPALFALYPAPLAKAGLFGLLAAAAFGAAPLARARATPPAALFRRDLSGRVALGPETVLAGAAALGLAAVAVLTAPSTGLAAGMIGGVAAAFLALLALGLGATRLAARLRVMARGPARLGLANLSGPRSAARTASPAIGLGVALLTALVLIQSSLLGQVRDVAPRTAPSVVFTDIPFDRAEAFDAEVAAEVGALTPETYQRMPLFTGRIVRLKGEPVVRERIPDERWAFDNDIVMSALDEPGNAGVAEGRWWPDGWRGEPQVVLARDVAAAASLRPGDRITVAVLGREIDLTLAATREAELGGFGPGFSVILSPNALEGAELRQLAIAKMTPEAERRLLRRLGGAFSEVNVISVREQLQAATELFDRLALAVRGAAGVAALAGVLVLAGAIAAGARARAREAALLKVLGASRGQVLSAYAVEYGAVGLIAGAAGAVLGAAAAWPVVVQVFEARWTVDWAGVFALSGGAALTAAAGGALAALHALSKRPQPVLRAE